MDEGLKRMYERMPTPEVNFFGIVMAIQQKSGGNLSEALGNLAGVLRDRKRLQGKIRAMSSEAKTGAMIIGSLPPGVMGLIYVSTPNYIMPLFQVQLGNLMLMGCVVWMTLGVLVMKKMIRPSNTERGQMNLSFLYLLLEREFLVVALSAIAAFATIVTLGLPYMKGDALEGRMKAVAERRDELRQKQREAFAQAGRREDSFAPRPSAS